MPGKLKLYLCFFVCKVTICLALTTDLANGLKVFYDDGDGSFVWVYDQPLILQEVPELIPSS